MARENFCSVFQENPNGSLTPKRRIRVGSIEFGPGVNFTEGVSFGGIDFAKFKGQDLEVTLDGDILVIKGIYARGQG